MRPTFYLNCQHWRSRSSEQNVLSEIYDGRIWKEYQYVEGVPFLAAPCTFGFILNVDWFQPYTHTVYSVGVIYLTIMNLPRTLRYKRENIIIIGIIPGPSEPAHDINSFLHPLIDELLHFRSGIKLRVHAPSGYIEENVKCALLCISCDLPAGRKSCGFLSHSARLGCSRCLKEFPGGVGSQDYSGFDRQQWSPRTDKEHRLNVHKIKECKTITEQRKAESTLGCRYSVFLDLPYFNAPRFLIIDPMHNLFLGTGKRMITLWIKEGWLSSNHFIQIQSLVDKMIVPSDIGRIPHKIQSGFSGFKADQFKTWITVFSIPALYEILPSNHFECWRHFVLACRILCKQSLSKNDIMLADSLLIYFCKRVENMFGSSCITPNMHMHGHLKDVLLDFGPVQEFWCYSFERYNGILGNQPTNNREVESQLLRRFLKDRLAYSFDYPQEFRDDFNTTMSGISDRLAGSVLDTISTNITEFRLPTKSARAVFDTTELMFLKQLYHRIYPDAIPSDTTVHSIFVKYSSVTLKGKIYRSSGRRTEKPYVVLASWDKAALFGSPPTRLPDQNSPTANERPVNVHYYVKATFSSETQSNSLILANVSWFFPHPERCTLGKPVQLWCSNMFESCGTHSFLPLDHLICRCAHGIKIFNDEPLLLVVPLVE